jgi:hypothetical protein
MMLGAYGNNPQREAANAAARRARIATKQAAIAARLARLTAPAVEIADRKYDEPHNPYDFTDDERYD